MFIPKFHLLVKNSDNITDTERTEKRGENPHEKMGHDETSTQISYFLSQTENHFINCHNRKITERQEHDHYEQMTFPEPRANKNFETSNESGIQLSQAHVQHSTQNQPMYNDFTEFTEENYNC